jgi:hypothetical protein
LIKFFLRFLKTAGICDERLVFQIHIHETADLATAERFWRETIGIEGATFNRPLIKRHRPRTIRKNTGPGYHGCLRVQVRHSADTYRRIEGWASAAMSLHLDASEGSGQPRDSQPRRVANSLPGEDSNLG